MRVFNYPAYSNAISMTSDHIWNANRSLVRNAVDHFDDDFWYMMIPKPIARKRSGGCYWSTPPQHIEQLTHPRIKLVQWDHHTRQKEEMRFISDMFWNDFSFLRPGYHFDVLLTGRVAVSPMLYLQIMPWHMSRRPRSFVYATRNVYVFDKHNEGDMCEAVLLAQALGWMLGYNIFDSNLQMKRAEDIVRRYLKASYVQKFRDNSIVSYTGFDCDEIDQIVQGVERPKDEFRINWSYRTYELYKFYDAFEIINDVFVTAGDNVKVILNSPSSGSDGTPRPRSMSKEEWDSLYKHFDIKVPCPRDEYLRRSASCHVAVITADDIEGSHTTFELLYLGVVVVMKDSGWNRTMLPHWPYRVKNKKEAYQLLMWLKDHWNDDEVRQHCEDVKRYIRSNYNCVENNLELIHFLRDAYCEVQRGTEPMSLKHTEELHHWTDILEKAADKSKFPMSYADFSAKVTASMDASWDFQKENIRFPITEINRGEWFSRIHHAGLYDDCQEEYPVIRRWDDPPSKSKSPFEMSVKERIAFKQSLLKRWNKEEHQPGEKAYAHSWMKEMSK